MGITHARRAGAICTAVGASIIALTGAVAAARGDDLTTQIREALEELRVEADGPMPREPLELALAALDAAAPLAALESLADARVSVAERRFAEAIGDEDEGDPDFDRLRRDLGQRAGELLDVIRKRASVGTRPAVVDGWIDIALARQKAYRDTAIGFADSAFPSSADDYLVRSLAQLEKAAFLLRFEFDEAAAPPPPDLLGLEAAIAETESRLLTRFTGTTADDRYPPTVVANASIDFSRKLIDAGEPGAAALMYLDAVTRLYDIEHKGEDPVNADRLAAAADEWNARIDAAVADSSIARYFLQSAQVDLAAPPRGVAESALLAALPAYFKLLEPPAADDAAESRAPVSTVTVLRYPYT